MASEGGTRPPRRRGARETHAALVNPFTAGSLPIADNRAEPRLEERRAHQDSREAPAGG
jgi:hypothetical protein